MKAGTSIFMIIIMIFSLGFVLKDDIETHQKVAALEKQVKDLTLQVNELKQILEAYLQEKERNEQRIAELTGMVEAQNAMIDELNRQIAELKSRNSTLETRMMILDFIEQNPYLLIGAILAQATTSLLGLRKKAVIRVQNGNPASNVDYVKLNQEERALIINLRRNRANRQ